IDAHLDSRRNAGRGGRAHVGERWLLQSEALVGQRAAAAAENLALGCTVSRWRYIRIDGEGGSVIRVIEIAIECDTGSSVYDRDGGNAAQLAEYSIRLIDGGARHDHLLRGLEPELGRIEQNACAGDGRCDRVLAGRLRHDPGALHQRRIRLIE